MDSANKDRSETFFERNAWKVLLGFSIIIFLFGLGDIIQGANADPAIVESISGVPWEQLQATNPEVARLINLQVRAGGGQLIAWSFLSMVICLTGFKRGERWAWYAQWIFPLWSASVFVLFYTAERQPGFSPPPPMLSAPVFFALTALTLALSYRKFFPEKTGA